MIAVEKKYYTALLFEERPELHMTLRYFDKLLPHQLCSKIMITQGSLLSSAEVGDNPSRFLARFPRREILGWSNKVDVMMGDHNQDWPEWLRLLVLESKIETFHVTCMDNRPLTLTASAVAVMCKKEEICRWNLSEPAINPPKPIQRDLFS